MSAAKSYYHGTSSFPSFGVQYCPVYRKKVGMINCKLSDSNTKRATLSARKIERIKFPTNDQELDSSQKMNRFSEFLSHPSGIEAMLNTKALQTFQSLDSNTFRCDISYF
ncbi:hypothetical protein LIER_20886 [Lithospermum erythrorhizon]|uniref:Uncharacterized protein n=1 Tax=Lithospermum erythrorhizon TaxID=34254 RepID=A0AAV3QQZ4_LITER